MKTVYHPEAAPIKACFVADFLLTSPRNFSRQDLESPEESAIFAMCLLLCSFVDFFNDISFLKTGVFFIRAKAGLMKGGGVSKM